MPFEKSTATLMLYIWCHWHIDIKNTHISFKSKIQYHIEAFLRSGVGKEHFEI